jgi:starch synthase
MYGCGRVLGFDWFCLLQGPQMKIHVHGTEIGYYHHHSKGVDWVFVDHPSYPRPGGLYADAHGVYGDNQVCQ